MALHEEILNQDNQSGTVGPSRADMPANWQTTPAVDPTQQQGAGNLIDQTMQAQQQAILQPSPEEQRLLDQYKSQLTPISGEPGALPVSTLMPGIGHQIGVGTTSGSLIGSGNIYVPGGAVYGWGADMARQKALEESTQKRKEEEAAIGSKFEVRKPGQLTDQRFQESVNKEAQNVLRGFMSNIQEKYGEDYRYVMDHLQEFPEGREYVEKMDALDLVVGQANQITETLTAMQTSIDKGEKVYSEATIEKLKNVQNMLGAFESGDVNELIGLRKELMDLEGGKSLDHYFSQKGTLAKIKPMINKYVSVKPGYNIPDFATLSTTEKTQYQENIKELTEFFSSPTGPFAKELSMNLVSKEQISDYFNAFLKDQLKRDKSLVSTKGGGSGKPATAGDVHDLTGEASTRKYTTVDGGELVMDNMKREVNAAQTGKTITFSGAKTFNSDGSVQDMPLEGFQDGQVVSYASYDTGKTDSEGNPIYDPVVNVRFTETELVPVLDGLKMDYKEVKKTYEVPIIWDDAINEQIKTNYTSGGVQTAEEVDKIRQEVQGAKFTLD